MSRRTVAHKGGSIVKRGRALATYQRTYSQRNANFML